MKLFIFPIVEDIVTTYKELKNGLDAEVVKYLQQNSIMRNTLQDYNIHIITRDMKTHDSKIEFWVDNRKSIFKEQKPASSYFALRRFNFSIKKIKVAWKDDGSKLTQVAQLDKVIEFLRQQIEGGHKVLIMLGVHKLSPILRDFRLKAIKSGIEVRMITPIGLRLEFKPDTAVLV